MNHVLRWVCVLCFFVSGVFATPSTMSVTVDRTQPTFVVELPSNPTTGYQWNVSQFDQSLLELVSSQYRASRTQVVGAGGVMQFTFKLRAGESYPVSTNMTFSYARSWEPKSATMMKVVVNFGP